MSTFCEGVHINCTHADHYYANITCKLHTLMHDAVCITTSNTKCGNYHLQSPTFCNRKREFLLSWYSTNKWDVVCCVYVFITGTFVVSPFSFSFTYNFISSVCSSPHYYHILSTGPQKQSAHFGQHFTHWWHAGPHFTDTGVYLPILKLTYEYKMRNVKVRTWQRVTCEIKREKLSETTHTRGVQKARSLIQLTTEYEHDILSLFNIVPFNRNALSPVILQGPCSIVEEFLFLVLQPVTRSAHNIIVVSKFPSFREFLQFWKQTEVTGGQIWQIQWSAEQFKTCISDGSQCLWWRMRRCIVLMKRQTSSQLSSSLLFQCRSTFSNQICVLGSCNSSAMFQTVNQ